MEEGASDESLARSVDLLKVAHDKKVAMASYQLAISLQTGRGVKEDKYLAARMFEVSYYCN